MAREPVPATVTAINPHARISQSDHQDRGTDVFGSMDLDEQVDMTSNQSFRLDAQPQFPSQYQYPQGAPAFAMDQDMNLNADNFAASVQAHAAANLENNTSGPGSGHTGSNPNVSAPGMAPPQGAGHPYSPGGARASIDETQDGGLAGDDPKRKRSKVSRACDECRRKKVRCDAAADDGTIKTCSNCSRAGLTCEYSRIPMKRGPSKGYIKELSERVQQVESLQMALSGTPGYRPSLDGTGGVYSDQPYSPEDPMSAKRNFSFSGDQRSPFVGPEYHRDRMPSAGGWNSGSPRSTIFRARDQGSIALAPDQQPLTSVSFAKPFWAQEPEGPPPAKRQKTDMDDFAKPELSQHLLNRYYREFHAYLPVLPDAEVAITIVDKAAPKIQHAFVSTILRLAPPSVKPENGTSTDTNNPSATSTATNVFKSNQELDEFMWNAARESPELRSPEDNLLYLWMYLLMAVEAEADLTRLHDGALPRTFLIKQAVDLGWSCITDLSNNHTSPARLETEDKTSYLNDFARAWHCATILARLHALAVGSGSPIPRYFHQHFQKKVPTLSDVLPVSGIITALTASQLTVASMVVQDSLPPSQWGRNIDIQHRLTIQEAFDQTIDVRPHTEGHEPLLEQLRHFLNLVLSRYTVNFHPMDIVIPAAALAESLRKHLTASDGNLVYNPFHLHFFALTTITLLEFLAEGQDTEMFRIANTGLEDIKGALAQFSEEDHSNKGQQQEGVEAEIIEPARKSVHWSDALLKMIHDRVSNLTTTNGNGTASSGSGGTRSLGDGTNAMVDFSMLLRHGYLTVLAQQASH